MEVERDYQSKSLQKSVRWPCRGLLDIQARWQLQIECYLDRFPMGDANAFLSSAKASELAATCVAFSFDCHRHMHGEHSTEGLVKLHSKRLCARTCY